MVIAAPPQILTFTRTVKAPVSDVYAAFTQQDNLIYWLSDGAYTRPVVGEYLLLTWFPNGHASGRFTTLEENKQVGLTWRAAHDSGTSNVTATFESTGDTTTLTVTQSDLAEDADLNAAERFWNNALDNLVSFLENGADLRIANRVLIGINPGEFNAEHAARLGVPVTEGTRLVGVIPGLSAERAGLQIDDVIVQVNDLAISDNVPIFNVTGGKKPGDHVTVTYYRGSEKRTADITLMGYPIPQAVSDFPTLADRFRTVRESYVAEIESIFNGVSAAEADKKPTATEWSANQVLAHLILTERNLQTMFGSIAVDGPWPNAFAANSDARVNSVVRAYGGKDGLVAELKRALLETEHLLRGLPLQGVFKQGALWWTNFEVASFENHWREHFRQMRNAIEAARKA